MVEKLGKYILYVHEEWRG